MAIDFKNKIDSSLSYKIRKEKTMMFRRSSKRMRIKESSRCKKKPEKRSKARRMISPHKLRFCSFRQSNSHNSLRWTKISPWRKLRILSRRRLSSRKMLRIKVKLPRRKKMQVKSIYCRRSKKSKRNFSVLNRLRMVSKIPHQAPRSFTQRFTLIHVSHYCLSSYRRIISVSTHSSLRMIQT
jgi:hypothetical protein